MAISERLALLVSLDAQGAIKSFNDLGKAADKGLGKADQKLDRMASRFQKAGTGMLATAGLAAVGLYKAGQAAGDLEQAVGGTEAVFGKASAAIDDYAKKAAEAAGLSESAFRTATTSIGGQLKGLGFTTSEAADEAVKLTQVAADLSATYGGTTAEAVAALGAAFRGEADPAERFNLFLNQTRVNAKAVALGLAASTTQVSAQAKAQATLALITEQSADAQGQFAREADTAQGAMARFRAESDNLLAALGSAVAPVIADVADGLGGMVEGFNNLSPAQQGAISKFAVFTTAGLGAAGALSFTVGKVIDARENFGKLGSSLLKAEGGLSKVGLAAGGVTAAVGIFAIAMFKAKERADKLAAAAADLRQEAESTGETLETVATRNLAETFAESNKVAGAMDALGVSFSDLQGPLTGSQSKFDSWAESLRSSVAGQDDMANSANDLINRVRGLRAELDEARGDNERTADAVEELGVASDTAAPLVAGVTEKVDLQKEALDKATTSVGLFKDGMDTAFGDLTLEEATDRRASALEDMAQRFADAQEGVTGAKRRVADLLAIPVEDRSDTFARDLADAQKDVQDAIDETSRSLEGNSEAALQNREDIRGAVEDIGGIIQAHRDQGASMEELQGIREIEKTNLATLLEQMGFNREEIAKYTAAIDEIPITAETTVTVETATAEAKLTAWRERVQREIQLNPFSVDVVQAEKFAAGPRSVNPDRRAIGGPVTAGMGYSVNEYLGSGKGPEWFAPANGTISPSGPSSGTVVEQNVTIVNPLPEPVSTSARALRRVPLEMAG